MSSTLSRAWCFTQWLHDVPDEFPTLAKGMKYLIYGWEYGENGKESPHLQGYAYWNTEKSLLQCSKYLPGARWAKAKGTAAQNKTYCSKEGDWVEFGDIPQQGARTDLVEFRDRVKRDRGISEADTMEEYPMMLARYPKFCSAANRVYGKVRSTPPVVLVFWGETGTGKSRTANVLADFLGRVYRVSQAKGSGLYYDGYDGQEVLLFDEMYGNRMSWSSLLEVTDRYPNLLPQHGSSGVQNIAQYIIFCSNRPPSAWYQKIDSSPLLRRIHIVRRFSQRRTVPGVSDLLAPSFVQPFPVHGHQDPSVPIGFEKSYNKPSKNKEEL